MSRVRNWERVLDETLSAYTGRVFEYGKCDCFLFTMDVLSKITGEDWLGKSAVPSYENKTQATKILLEQFDGSMINLMDTMASQKDVAFVQRGNVVAVEFEEAFALGIFAYPSAKFVTDQGLMACSIKQVKYAWDT